MIWRHLKRERILVRRPIGKRPTHKSEQPACRYKVQRRQAEMQDTSSPWDECRAAEDSLWRDSQKKWTRSQRHRARDRRPPRPQSIRPFDRAASDRSMMRHFCWMRDSLQHPLRSISSRGELEHAGRALTPACSVVSDAHPIGLLAASTPKHPAPRCRRHRSVENLSRRSGR